MPKRQHVPSITSCSELKRSFIEVDAALAGVGEQVNLQDFFCQVDGFFVAVILIDDYKPDEMEVAAVQKQNVVSIEQKTSIESPTNGRI